MLYYSITFKGHRLFHNTYTHTYIAIHRLQTKTQINDVMIQIEQGSWGHRTNEK